MAEQVAKKEIKKERKKTIERPAVVLIRIKTTNRKLVDSLPLKIIGGDKKRKITPGEHWEVKGANIWSMVKTLFKNNYCLVGAYRTIETINRWKKAKKYNITLTFVFDGKPAQKLNKKQLKQLDQLLRKDGWGYIHYHENTNGVMSLTCVNRLPNRAQEVDELDFDF